MNYDKTIIKIGRLGQSFPLKNKIGNTGDISIGDNLYIFGKDSYNIAMVIAFDKKLAMKFFKPYGMDFINHFNLGSNDYTESIAEVTEILETGELQITEINFNSFYNFMEKKNQVARIIIVD